MSSLRGARLPNSDNVETYLRSCLASLRYARLGLSELRLDLGIRGPGLSSSRLLGQLEVIGLGVAGDLYRFPRRPRLYVLSSLADICFD